MKHAIPFLLSLLAIPAHALFANMRVLACFWILSGCCALAAERPNILWLTAEDMSPTLGCYGDPQAKTPEIDRLAERSVRYTRAYAESPMCSPSRSTIITGMHNGPLGTSQMRSQHPVPDFVKGFPAWLREAGYYTCNNVKTDYNLGDEAAFIREAWDESSPKAHWRGRPEGKPFFCVLNYLATHQSRASRDGWGTYERDVRSKLSADELSDPSQMALPPFWPDTEISRKTLARYYDCVTSLDHWVAKVLRQLEEDGLAEETIVFFYSDHGAGIPGGKAAAFHFGLRVPLLVHVPEKWRHLAPGAPGSASDRLVGFVDFGPTVLSLAGVEVPKHMHGRPFLGTQAGEPRSHVTGTRDRQDETLETTRWIADGKYHLVRSYDPRPPGDQQSLRSYYNKHGELCREIRALAKDGKPENWPHFWEPGRQPVMLFDVETDPWCLRDLAAEPEHAAVRDALLAKLERHLLETVDLGFWPEPEMAAGEKEGAAWDRAREGGYPIDQIHEVAKRVGLGSEHRAVFVEALKDKDAKVRYWGAMGLAVLGDPKALAASLDDEAPSVRIVAAETAGRAGDEPALDVLIGMLGDPNEWTASRAARSLELLGEKARPRAVEMKAALERRKSRFFGDVGPEPANYGLEFALRNALEEFGMLEGPLE